jgi:hypothetical protein
MASLAESLCGVLSTRNGETPGQNSVLIIGPRHDKHPAPPIHSYFMDHDLGNWIFVGVSGMKRGKGFCQHPRTGCRVSLRSLMKI